jgi:hypothetical protein
VDLDCRIDGPLIAQLARAGTTDLRAAGDVAITVTTAVCAVMAEIERNALPTTRTARPAVGRARRDSSPRF